MKEHPFTYKKMMRTDCLFRFLYQCGILERINSTEAYFEIRFHIMRNRP